MTREIKKVAIIGSGIMGSGIACLFANMRVKVLLLNQLPKELNEVEKQKGFSLTDKEVRNRAVNTNLAKVLQSKPSPIYGEKFLSYITTGNLEDDIYKIKDADWIIEAVKEDLEVKRDILRKIDTYRALGTLVSTNTSGIQIALLNKDRSEDFRHYFAVTHFFNPPRHLPLLEIIPGPDCKQKVIDFLIDYTENFLGKTPVLAKDTPAFIANRVGIFSMMSIFHEAKNLDLSVTEIDNLTGTIIGRPKSATFRTADVVGLDTLALVVNGIREDGPDDESDLVFQLPDFIQKMLINNWLGSKKGQGFYKKVKGENNNSEILELNLQAMEYQKPKKMNFEVFEAIKFISYISERILTLIETKGKIGRFYRKIFADLFAYVQKRIPEISSELYQIDDALRAGFGWKNGPFEIWDAMGLRKGVEFMKSEGYEPSMWIEEMMNENYTTFYSIRDGFIYYYDIPTRKYQKKPRQEGFIILNNLRKEKVIWKNSEVSLFDLEDGILNLEFHSKVNTISKSVLNGINEAIDIAEKNYRGLVVANQGENFSVGANLKMILALASEGKYGELEVLIRYFQDTMMRMRYSSIPTVAAPHGMTLGGGCELCLHADKIVAAAESYIGLVEFGVGLIPGGGGTKEMALRFSDFMERGGSINTIQKYFLVVSEAKVSTSAYGAFDNSILREGKDMVIMNKLKQISEAKKQTLLLADSQYTQPSRREIKVFGRQALEILLLEVEKIAKVRSVSGYDKKIANKLAYVISGGNLSEATSVSEQYLLDLEREAFLSLCAEKKTQDRIAYMLKTGKPLRN